MPSSLPSSGTCSVRAPPPSSSPSKYIGRPLFVVLCLQENIQAKTRAGVILEGRRVPSPFLVGVSHFSSNCFFFFVFFFFFPSPSSSSPSPSHPPLSPSPSPVLSHVPIQTHPR